MKINKNILNIQVGTFKNELVNITMNDEGVANIEVIGNVTNIVTFSGDRFMRNTSISQGQSITEPIVRDNITKIVLVERSYNEIVIDIVSEPVVE